VQMAEQLLQMKLLTRPEQYFQVLNTGRLDSMYEGEMAELLNIKRENEMLMDGDVPQALSIDKHSEHIMEHKAVLSDPDLRNDPTLVKNTLDHIQQHIDLLRHTDPGLLQLIGETPLPPPPPPPGSQPPPGMMPPGGPPPGMPQGGPPPSPGPGPNGPPPPQHPPMQHGQPHGMPSHQS